jgi:lysophospholipase L1-like esterase
MQVCSGVSVALCVGISAVKRTKIGKIAPSDATVILAMHTVPARLLLASTLLLGVAASLWLQSRYFSVLPDNLAFRAPVPITERAVRIAIVGDSWAAGRKMDELVRAELGRLGWTVEVVSFGQPGARSQLIYHNLFEPRSEENSSHDVLFGAPVHAAIVIAGVNDSSGYIGADHYAHHTTLIAKALHQRGILPLILELPEYGIEHATSSDPLGVVRRRLMRWVFHGDQFNVIDHYRQTLDAELRRSFRANEYHVIDFDPVTSDFHASPELFEPDALHLSAEGRRRLAHQIGVSIEPVLASKLRTPPALIAF